MTYTQKAYTMTARDIALLVMSEDKYVDAVITWRTNNRGVCSLKAQILGSIMPEQLVRLELAKWS